MVMIDKKSLLEISDLKIAGKIELMSEEKFNSYIQELTEYVEHYPGLEGNIHYSLKLKDYDSFSTHLTSLCKRLEDICAFDLLDECRRKTENFRSEKPEKLKAYITYFLSITAELSIDIQVKFHEAEESAKSGKNKQVKGVSQNAGKRGKHILAVDDTPFFLNMLKSALKNSEYNLTCVNSGKGAMTFLEKYDPDLFLLDIDMPNMTGFELITNIRRRGHTAPVIFLTGNFSKEYVTMALYAGAADFIVKPINIQNVLERISKHI